METKKNNALSLAKKKNVFSDKPVLSIDRLSVIFRQRGKPFLAVNGVSFDVKQGEIFGLVGESGSGKTTTGRTVLGLIKSSFGTVQILNHRIPSNPIFITAKMQRWLARNAQMIFQDPFSSLNPSKRAIDIVGEGLSNYNPYKEEAKLEKKFLAAQKKYEAQINGYIAESKLKESVEALNEIISLRRKLFSLINVDELNLKQNLKDAKVKLNQTIKGSKTYHKMLTYERDKVLNDMYVHYNSLIQDSFDTKKQDVVRDKYETMLQKDIKPTIIKRRKVRDKKAAEQEVLFEKRDAIYVELANIKSKIRAGKYSETIKYNAKIEKNYAQIKKIMETNSAELKQILVSKNGTYLKNKQEVFASKTKSKRQIKVLEAEIAELNTKIKAAEYHLNLKYNHKIDAINNQLKSITAKYRPELRELTHKINKYRTKWKENLAKELNEQSDNKAITSYQQEYTQKVSEVKSDFTRRLATDKTKILKLQAQAKAQYQKNVVDINQSLKNLAQKKAAIESQIDGWEKKFQELVSSNQETGNKLANKSQSLTNAYTKDLSSFKAKYQAELTKLDNQQKSGNQKLIEKESFNIRSNLAMNNAEKRKSIAAIKNKYQSKVLSEINTLKSKYAKIESNLTQKYINDLKTCDLKKALQTERKFKFNNLYSAKAIKKRTRELILETFQQVGLLTEHAWRYPTEFSGGQRQRIGIARALILHPKLIVADEPIAALDVSIQAQIINLLQDLREKYNVSILLIAHDLRMINYVCDRIGVITAGKLVEIGDSDKIFYHPVHPYTKALIASVPSIDNVGKEIEVLTYNPNMHYQSGEYKPSWQSISSNHKVLATPEELTQWTTSKAITRTKN